jgi:uncharacterized cupin superfamily protein
MDDAEEPVSNGTDDSADSGDSIDSSDGTDSSDRIVTPEDREWTTTEQSDRKYRRAQLGRAAGSEKLGCSLYEIPPGKKAWPYHFHTGNEEAMYVLAGEATLRTPEGEQTASAGSYAAFPTGGDGAHEVRNDGDDTLRYLAFSTMRDPDVLGYPDSEKVGVLAGSAPGGESSERVFSEFFFERDAVDYWDGEAEE